MSRMACRGAIFHLLDDPDKAGPEAAVYYDDGVLIVEDGVITGLLPWSEEAVARLHAMPVEHFPDGLILPGFIDTHVHYAQAEIMAAPGTELLEWLSRYTFSAEGRYGYAEVAGEAAVFFLDQLLANGVTSALTFPTVHRLSVEALFAAALARNMRLISGKVLMDINAPPALCDTVETGYFDSVALIRDFHGRGRLGYAVTPRFALTSSPQQLEMAGRLLTEHPGVLLHSHLSENLGELRAARQLYPDYPDYFSIYEKYGLATDHAVYAHGIYLSAAEWARVADCGATIVHCPTSNTFLGSGLFNLDAARAVGAQVTLGSDVGAGTSLSPFATMAEAYKVARLKGVAVDAAKLFYMATLGAARALKIDSFVGNLTLGKEADFVVVNAHRLPLLARRWAHAQEPMEKLFALALLGDDRAVARSYVAGVETWRRTDD